MSETTCPTLGCPRPPRHRGWCPKPKGPCVVDGCTRVGSVGQAGRCKVHQRRWLATGDVGTATIRIYNPGAECSIDGCSKVVAARGWCDKHYMRFYVHGDPLALLTRERTGIRTCFRCERTPEEVAFRLDKRAPDGLGAYCKPCEKAYNAAHYNANREAVNADNNARYYANRERYLARQHIWRAENIEKCRERERNYSRGNPLKAASSRRWRQENRDRCRALHQRWRDANREHVRQKAREWRAANPDRAREISANTAARRSAQKRSPNGRVEHINRRYIWKRDGGICGLCALPVPFREMHLDHFIPLSKGGSHTKSNVHATHSSCNLIKGNREVPKWAFAKIVVPETRRSAREDLPMLF
jgi:5-methylcytosine-specific restriction endonuclease McrA